MQHNKNYPYDIAESNGKIVISPQNITLSSCYKNAIIQFYNFESRPDDIWLFGYPRCGTTLTQEILWLIENDLNYKNAAETVLDIRFPLFEMSGFVGHHYERLKKEKLNYRPDLQRFIEKWCRPSWEILNEMKEKRLIKTHFPISLANPNLLKCGSKIIFITRNPKDVLVSYYELLGSTNHRFQSIGSDFESFARNWMAENRFFNTVKEGWKLRNNENVLFIFYEDYKKDSAQFIKKIANFLGKSLSDEEIAKMQDHLKIDNFRRNKSVNNEHYGELGVMKSRDVKFIRKGNTGDWKNYFSRKINEECDAWIEENLKDTNLIFPNV